MHYERTLSDEWLGLLREGGALRSLILAPGAIGDVPIDVQFRREQEVVFYAGMTAVLRLRLHHKTRTLRCDAHSKYRTVAPRLFDEEYPLAETSELVARWEAYRAALKPDARWFHREGYWQARCSIACGLSYQIGSPFLAVDREVILAHDDTPAKELILGPILDQYRDVRGEITRLLGGTIGRSLDGEFGMKVDLLAVSSEGDVCIVELKEMDAAGIYCAPVQLGGYVELWDHHRRNGLDVAAQINGLIEQKQAAGLLPQEAPKVSKDFRIRPYLVIGGPKPLSGAWQTLRQVWAEMRRLRPGIVDDLEICRIDVSDMDAVSLTSVTELVRTHGRITPPDPAP